jgi:hypothetical protein
MMQNTEYVLFAEFGSCESSFLVYFSFLVERKKECCDNHAGCASLLNI